MSEDAIKKEKTVIWKGLDGNMPEQGKLYVSFIVAGRVSASNVALGKRSWNDNGNESMNETYIYTAVHNKTIDKNLFFKTAFALSFLVCKRWLSSCKKL